ncbi:MAG: type II toxin-antitoxin system RelE/ParE family toxin [Thiobacillus sp.]|nr:type II toxin-antitoxin system RelE/ParE family toxin [Thiobacillus sp.]MDP2977379.1 type II toxin-antitoxin system RelE/ParE family toxin [Thiobacillus sp.]
MAVSFNAEALAEAEEATHWYRDNGGTQPSHAFVQELRCVIRLAAETPKLGSPGSHNVLRLYLKRFPYTLVYRSQNETLRVIAVAHQSRCPGYWAGRR